jgi:hypothetical protein
MIQVYISQMVERYLCKFMKLMYNVEVLSVHVLSVKVQKEFV